MKKNYESPDMKLVVFSDVITASGGITEPTEPIPGSPAGGDTPGVSYVS